MIVRYSKQSVISDMILPGHMGMVRSLCCVFDHLIL